MSGRDAKWWYLLVNGETAGAASLQERASAVIRLIQVIVLGFLLVGWASNDLVSEEGNATGSVSAHTRASADLEEVIVFTANQGFMSRIYLLRMDGSVITYFQYDPYRFVDLEVVDNEVYASEAFAPRVLKVDLHTGDLDVIVDDWSLYYFYGLAFDGTYWYLDEWDLNKYEFDGTKVGVASFDEEVMGSAWDGEYLWTLNDDENRVKCWSVSSWPLMVEVPGKGFSPPSGACRGLWFDGEYFWTAESIEETLGQIYRFDYDGTIVDRWLAPAFRGWGAGVVRTAPFRLSVDFANLSWTEAIGAYAYDVVKGDLRTLRRNSGDFSVSVDECLEENVEATSTSHGENPPVGGGFWYLVRGVSAALNLTYDSGGPSQVCPRDDAIDADIDSCM